MRTLAENAAPVCPVEALTESAFADLTDTLMRYGNKLDVKTPGGRRHREALRAVLRTYSELAITREPGRVAFPLAVGVGKTQSIASWCAAVYRQGLPLSVLVCQEQLDSLEDLYGDLLKKGVPAERIGLWHSKPHDPAKAATNRDFAALPSCEIEDVEQFQFLLVTHSKIKGGKDAERLNRYGIEERSLCIWDESLIRNDGKFILAESIELGLSAGTLKIKGKFARAEIASDATVRETLAYLEACVARLSKAIEEQLETGSRQPIHLPARDSAAIERYEQVIKDLLTSGKAERDLKQQLLAFLQVSQEPLRMVDIRSGSNSKAAITYLPKVPDELQRIVVLDASFHVRELEQLDSTLRCVHDYEHVKRFDAVTVQQVKENGGRTSLEKLRTNSKLFGRVVQDILATPENEAVLVITYKTRKGVRGPMEKLQESLAAAGANLEETILVQVWNTEGRVMEWHHKPRFVFVHWGQHRAISRFAYCRNMIAVGVLRRNMIDLSASVVAQTEDHRSTLADDRRYLERISASEQFYCLQQFIGRGACREIVNGDARPATVKVYDQTDFAAFLKDGLPGATWEVQERERRTDRRKRKKRAGTKTGKLAAEIVGFLGDFDSESITVRELRRHIDTSASKQTFQEARKLALKQLPTWSLEGATLTKGLI